MPNRVTLEHIERMLCDPGRVSDEEISGDHAFKSDWISPDPGRVLKDAAVLVPIVDRPGGLTVVLTKRADHLNSHAGQVSFPGGRAEEVDGSAEETALRETEEEIGLSREFISIMGGLDLYETGTGFSIQPIVGLVREGFCLTVDKGEVAEAFEVPLDFLMDPKNHLRHSAVWQGKRREYYAMPYGNYYIWGATAGMLVNFYKRVYG
jgi:8-oxo-dGTP pyrophosphatase MutT (NUDIX family)